MSDVPAGKVPIFASAGVAYNYLAENWMRWLPACGILGLLTGYMQVEAMKMATAAGSGGAAISPGYLLSGALVLLFGVTFMAGLYRHVIRDQFTAPIGLSFAIDELRLLGVQVSLGLIMGIIGFFIMFIGMIMVVAMAANSGVDLEQSAGDPEALAAVFEAAFASGGGLLLAIMIILAVSLAVFASVRLSLVLAATIGEEKMMIFSTWGWTKGNFWRVLAAMLAVVLPLSLGLGVVSGILQAILLGGGVASSGNAGLFVIGAVTGAMNGLIYVATAGLMGHLYKGLRPDQPVETVFD